MGLFFAVQHPIKQAKISPYFEGVVSSFGQEYRLTLTTEAAKGADAITHNPY